MVSNTTTDFECVVVGGGVIGLAVARKLSMDGFDVVLVKKMQVLVKRLVR